MLHNEQEFVKRLPSSLLSRGQRAWLTAALALAGLLIANTLYLVFNRVTDNLPRVLADYLVIRDDTIPKFFQIMVLSHTGLGVLVVGLLLAFAVWHLPRVWRRHRRRTVISGIVFVATGIILLVTGLKVLTAAASREHAWVWWTHVAAAVIVPVAYLVHRSLSYVPPQPRSYKHFATVTVLVLAAFLVGHGFSNRAPQATREAQLAAERGSYDGPGSKARELADFVPGKFVPAGFVPPPSPFFPSPATTITGDYLPERIITRGDVSSADKLAADIDRYGFAVDQKIGAETCNRCHADIVEQWSKSAHRFASFNNPFYEATVTDMRKNARAETQGVHVHLASFPQWSDRTGEIRSKWCSGCHDPAIMLAGKMTEDIDRRSAQAQAGLTCLACHAIDTLHSRTGNGNYNIADEQEDPYLFPNAKTDSVSAKLHDMAIKAKPDVHKRQMLKPFFRTAEFCGTCHKVSLPEAVNDYRWFRGQNEYDNWHDSGVAHNASRTFYLPPAAKVCQDCHMPPEEATRGDVAAKDGKVRSHRFLAVNTALPFVRGDQDTIARTEAFLRDEKLRIDVFAMTPESGTDTETVMALNHTQPLLTAGEKVVFDVVVRNKGVGHTFPGGTNDSNEGWIEFSVLDESGRTLAYSGYLGEDGYVDPEAHYFRALIVDRHSEAIRRRNAQDMYAPVYANVIGPGTAHTVHYGLTIPEDAGPSLTLRTRLLWRKFDRGYTEFAFANNREGFRQFESCPDLPITEICRDEVTLQVRAPEFIPGSAEGSITTPHHVPPDQWMRFNDYGIGLLLQGHTEGAAKAFAEVARLRPDLIDGPRNLARVAIQDSNLPVAYEHLKTCEALVSNDPQTAWFWGLVLQEDGRYAEAVKAYERVLQRFPNDRATWRNIGRTEYLDGQYEKALEAFETVLKIEPEDRVSHYHQMLCLRALGREEQADTAEEAYMIYKIDDSQAEVTQKYRLEHPADNVESQPIHVHELKPRDYDDANGHVTVASVNTEAPTTK